MQSGEFSCSWHTRDTLLERARSRVQMGIVQRILDRQALGSGSTQQVAVGGDESKSRQRLSLDYLAGLQSRRQLHGIIGTCIKEAIAHVRGPRWSWRISPREGPPACLKIMRTSSRVTAGMILSRRVVLKERTRPAACRAPRAVRGWTGSRASRADSRSSRLSVAGSWPTLRACASSRL